MKEFSHNKGWNSGINPAHVEPPPISLIKETYNGKSDKYCFNLKLRSDHMFSTSNLYEFKMSLFDHGNLEEFLLFIRNFNITLAATGTLEMDAKSQYLCTLVRGGALC